MEEPLDRNTDELIEEDHLPSTDERTLATFAHLGPVAGLIVPFGSILLPLIIWMTQREKSAFIDDQGKEALNFQITMLFGFLICIVLIFVIIGIPLLIILYILDLVFSIIAAIKANKGEYYRYPFNLRLIK